MSDKDTKGFVSTDEGTQSSTEVGKDEPEGQTPDQFFTGAPDPDEKVDPKHATKGMTNLGYTEASRIEGTAAKQLAEQKAAEKAAAKGD